MAKDAPPIDADAIDFLNIPDRHAGKRSRTLGQLREPASGENGLSSLWNVSRF